MIKHNIYFDGRVQSLGSTTAEGRHFTVGIITPGEWDFGVAESSERIITFNGQLLVNDMMYLDEIRIKKGESIVAKANDVIPYICWYGE